MRQLRSLVWKEWREARAFLWIGLGVFTGLPLIGGLEALVQHSRRFEITTTLWVLPFAGVLAVFAAVGATCRDFGGRLEEFWHAQPVGVLKRLLIKYFVGLAIVLIVCILPLLTEWAVDGRKDPGLLLQAAWLPFTWTALYSLGFAAGCLVRRAAHAGMLALSAMLLVYFLPVVLPPLEWLNVQTITDGVRYDASSPAPQGLKFAIGMLGISLASLTLGVVAVRRRWHVDSGRKMMYGAVSAAILIVFASAAFRLGTNLPILQQIDLPKNESVVFCRVEGKQGFLITEHFFPTSNNEYGPISYERNYRPVEIGTAQIKIGDPTKSEPGYQFASPSADWEPQNPASGYVAVEYLENGKDVCFLYHAELPWNGTPTMPRKLWEYDQEGKSYGKYVPVCIWQNQLYVIGTRVVRIDLNHIYEKPEVLAAPFPYSFDNQSFGADKVVLQLPPVPQLPPRQRLQAVLNQPDCVLEDNVLCASRGDSLIAYHLTKLTEATATFEKTGQYEDSLLDKIFGSYRYSSMKLQNGLLYVSGAAGGGLFNPHVTVFDARGGQGLRPVGHFAAPGNSMLACPLLDGRVLIAGSKLWMVEPPRLHRPG